MDIAVNKTFAVFRTAFSETEDLVQAFSGLKGGAVNDQDPVDFLYAALIRRDCGDIWHADRVLALSTDEAPPQVINGHDIGANHALECAVSARTEGQPLSFADIGTLWRDADGLEWTCVKADGSGEAQFVSRNLGASDYDFAFSSSIAHFLRRGDQKARRVISQRSGIPMTSSLRHLRRRIRAFASGRGYDVRDGFSGCEEARIEEVYEIVNPVSAVRTLREMRPGRGYGEEQSLSLGDAMLRAEITYHITSGGAVVTAFDYTLTQPVRWQGCLGLMYQEKCCPRGGSVRRCIPDLLPFEDGGRLWDFSVPRDLSGPFPVSFPAVKETWRDPDYPPDRQIEQILFPSPDLHVNFAAGILPILDGEAAVRRDSVSDALRLVSSRKSYITFCGASSPGEGKQWTFGRRRGAAYRLYYPAEGDFSCYGIPFRGSLWLFADWMGASGRERTHTFQVPRGWSVTPYRLIGDARGQMRGASLMMSGGRGYGIWRMAPGDSDKTGDGDRSGIR